MKVVKIIVQSRKSVMQSATGDYTASITLEANLDPADSSPEMVKQIYEQLQSSADYLVEQHISKRGQNG